VIEAIVNPLVRLVCIIARVQSIKPTAPKFALCYIRANLPPPWGRVVRDDNEADAVLILRWWEAQNAACSMCANIAITGSFCGK
jgi:hypothetical protein